MMNTWFECRIRYEKVMENGMSKKVTEPYLGDALSFTEAEARIIEQMAPYISGEFTVRDIKRASYSEVFYTDEEVADKWYKGRLGFIAVDEKAGKEKITYTNVLVQAYEFRDAVKLLDEGMKGSMADYVIILMQETAIMDVYEYEQTEDPNQDENIKKGLESPVISQFLASLPDGCRTEIVVKGKTLIIDRTDKGTKVTPKENEE
jgi:hypothetical protein